MGEEAKRMPLQIQVHLLAREAIFVELVFADQLPQAVLDFSMDPAANDIDVRLRLARGSRHNRYVFLVEFYAAEDCPLIGSDLAFDLFQGFGEQFLPEQLAAHLSGQILLGDRVQRHRGIAPQTLLFPEAVDSRMADDRG